MNAGFDLEDLPEQICELVELIGFAATMMLVRVYGGGSLRVPFQFNDDSPLARLIGAPATVALIGRYGGTMLYIARCARALRVRRNIQIAQDYGDGVKVPQLRVTYALTERQIWSILKDPVTLRAPDATNRSQPGLFD